MLSRKTCTKSLFVGEKLRNCDHRRAEQFESMPPEVVCLCHKSFITLFLMVQPFNLSRFLSMSFQLFVSATAKCNVGELSGGTFLQITLSSIIRDISNIRSHQKKH